MTLIIFFLIGCSDATIVDKTETIESTLPEPTLPEPTYTYLRCEDKDESWKDDNWYQRKYWANPVLKIDSDSETVFHNGPDFQWRKTSTLQWGLHEIMLIDSGYYFVESDIININRESLNAWRIIGWHTSRPGQLWNYGCEIMNELESTNYEDMFAKSREELLRTGKEKAEEQKKKNKI